MQVVPTRAELDTARDALVGRVAFVPTMGNLHEGHLRLVAEARAAADAVIASVFVNPLQFGPGEDFAAYPRTFEADRKALKKAKVAVLYAPGADELYPDGPEATAGISVPHDLAGDLEGRSRPGHFDGVATVVQRLFEHTRPDVALFGEKDYQQLLVIRWLVAKFSIPVTIVAVPTVRADDGLALSSRNQYLTRAERRRAPELYRTLGECAAAVSDGETDLVGLAEDAVERLAAAGFEPDYVAIRDADDLSMPSPKAPKVVLGAARLGKARLIDNIRV